MLIFSAVEQTAGPDTENPGQSGNYSDGRIADPALDATDVSPVKVGLEGEILLGPALAEAEFPNVEADLAPDIHAPEQTIGYTIRLQTMSLIA